MSTIMMSRPAAATPSPPATIGFEVVDLTSSPELPPRRRPSTQPEGALPPPSKKVRLDHAEATEAVTALQRRPQHQHQQWPQWPQWPPQNTPQQQQATAPIQPPSSSSVNALAAASLPTYEFVQNAFPRVVPGPSPPTPWNVYEITSAEPPPPRPRGRPRRDATNGTTTTVLAAAAVTSTRSLPIAQQRTPFVTPLLGQTAYNLRCRARAEEWSRGVDLEDSDAEDDDADEKEEQRSAEQEWLALEHRPYICYADRRRIAAAARRFVPPRATIYHVDFTETEVLQLHEQWKALLRAGVPSNKAVKRISLPKRHTDDILAFVKDEKQRDERLGRKDDDEAIPPGQVLHLAVDNADYRGAALRASKVSDLLLAREIAGARAGLRSKTLFRILREDDLELAECYDGGAGDIVTLTWIDNDTFFCGTTTHSDNQNQQYNKPENLMIGCPGTVRSIPGHRIPRPRIVPENATAEQQRAAEDMYRSQSPWLYTSVVSSHYSKQLDLALTSSFDKTVKLWKVGQDAPATMDPVGTWPHEGRVNFVVVSKHASCMVATAADVPNNAIRVYRPNRDNLSESPYTEFSCSRVLDAAGNPMRTVGWAYFPATMAWGQAPGTEHLLLVGYSPRALPGFKEEIIPEDKDNTGEVCLWDCLTNTRVHITTASTQNVFEVAWNPVLPSFLIATSPGGNQLDLKSAPGTQVRMFQPVMNPVSRLLESFSEFKCLDCPAKDINELVVRPNSGPRQLHCYVAAASTDGCVYVWDSADGDQPIHVLRHAPAMVDLQGIDGSQGYDDNGVKFIAWGSTPDRIYTGSADGCVKVWNIRQKSFNGKGRRTQPLVRDILQAKGAVSCGVFSPDFRKLAVGDASGQIHILTLDGRPSVPKESLRSCLVTIPGRKTKVRRPQRVIPHREDPNDSPESLASGAEIARSLVSNRQITILPRPVGAVQGPEYGSLMLYCAKAHRDGDPAQPLLPEFAFGRRHNLVTDELRSPGAADLRLRRMGRATLASMAEVAAAEALHARNLADDFNLLSLPDDVRQELAESGVDLEQESGLYEFNYED